MRSAVIGLVLLLVLATAPAPAAGQTSVNGCEFPFAETDVTGTEVTIDSEPDRIVTLGASAAQTMWEIGAQEKVVGVSQYAFYLEGAENRTNIWAETSTNVEKVIELQPDLVLAPNIIPNDTVETLRRAGLTVYKFRRATSIEFIYGKTRLTGELVGECDAADRRVNEMRRDIDTIREAVDGVERPRVLYTFFGFTAGSDTFVDTIITTAGGRNVATEAGISGFKPLSEEIVVARNPQWLLLNSDGTGPPDSAAYQGTDAVENGNFVTVDANYISQPAPRIVQPITALVKAMHPKAYEEANLADGDETGPSFTIESAALSVRTVELHQTVTITANVTNEGPEGRFTAWLFVDDGLRSSTDFRIRGGQTETITIRRTFSSLGEHEVRLNDRPIGTVSVQREVTATPTERQSTAPTTTSTPTAEAPPPATTTPTAETPPPTDAPPASPTSAPEATTPRSTATDGQPGFGVLVALLALLTTAAMASRRR